MAESANAILRIHGRAGLPVEEVRFLLSDIERCYNSILVFEREIDRIADETEFFASTKLFYRRLSPLFWLRPDAQYHGENYLIPSGSRLILKHAALHSPGSWDFLGKLNPLEVMRLALNDWHERRKDREYREDAERERLHLENELKRSEIFRQRYELLRDMGATEEELAPLRNRLLHEPLERLKIAQSRRLIENAEILPEPERR